MARRLPRKAAAPNDGAVEPGRGSAFPRVRLDWRCALPACLVAALALGLRLWGIRWGLPSGADVSSYHPDEAVNLFQGVLDHGNLRPHLDLGFYNYGSLYFYLWQAAAAINQSYGLVRAPGAGINLAEGATATVGAVLLVGRILTALLGTLTLWPIYEAGRRLYSRSAGLTAAVCWAILPAAVIHGHFATVDVPATFFVACALAFGARMLREPSWRFAVAAGACAGLAAATKYNCGLVLFGLLTAAFLAKGSRTRLCMAAAAVGGCVAAFLIACPAVWMSWPRFWADFTFELQKSQQGMGLLFQSTGNGYVYHFVSSLRYGLAMPMLALCVVALVVAAVRVRRPGNLYLFGYLAPYYLVIGAAQVRYLRYVIPILPVLVLFVGGWLGEPHAEARALRRAVRALGALAVMMTVLITMALCSTMAGGDARDAARAYVASHLPSGSIIAFATTPFYYTPRLTPAFGAPTSGSARRQLILEGAGPFVFRLPAQDTEWDESVLAAPKPDAVIVSDLETQDAERLHYLPAVHFLQQVRNAYEPVVFENMPTVCGLRLGKPAVLPNDWLYIYPRVTVYRLRR